MDPGELPGGAPRPGLPPRAGGKACAERQRTSPGWVRLIDLTNERANQRTTTGAPPGSQQRSSHATSHVATCRRHWRAVPTILGHESEHARSVLRGGDRHARESTQPVRTCRKGSGRAAPPAVTRGRVVHQEHPIALQRLDPRPRAPSSHPRAQVPPWLEARGPFPPRLPKHGPPSIHPLAGALSLRRDRHLRRGHALPQLLEHLGLRPELRRDREPQLDRLGIGTCQRI